MPKGIGYGKAMERKAAGLANKPATPGAPATAANAHGKAVSELARSGAGGKAVSALASGGRAGGPTVRGADVAQPKMGQGKKRRGF